MTNHDDMDDLTKHRMAKEVDRMVDAAVDVVDIMAEVQSDNTTARTYLVGLGLRTDAWDLGLVTPVSQTLGSMTGRMFLSGIKRDAVSQVLFGVWQGRRYIPELDAITNDQARLQTRRFLSWALDEMAILMDDDRVENTPSCAWFLMGTVLDVLERVVVKS